MNESTMQRLRYNYEPKIPKVFAEPLSLIKPEIGEATHAQSNQAELKEIFPHTYGMPIIRFVKGKSEVEHKPLKIRSNSFRRSGSRRSQRNFRSF